MRTILLGLLLLSQGAFAQFEPEKIYHGETSQEVSLNEIVSGVEPGTVVFLGEIHDSKAHHQHQRDFLTALKEFQTPISVGMEFFNYLQQSFVDQFVQNKIPEKTFLELVKWGSTPFEFYREQVKFPFLNGGETVALNAPRELTYRIAQVGLEGLNEKEKALLPPNFEMGNADYFDRFVEAVSQHGDLDPETIRRYFQAQCVWDDTMAWQAKLAMERIPGQTLVILVGDFHVQYGGGLPDRLHKRGHSSILNISQVAIDGLNKDEQAELILPSPTYGPRANFVWVSE